MTDTQGKPIDALRKFREAFGEGVMNSSGRMYFSEAGTVRLRRAFATLNATVKESLTVQAPEGFALVPIEPTERALLVALGSLDDIGAMTKKGRASLMARAAAIFIRAQLDAANRKVDL